LKTVGHSLKNFGPSENSSPPLVFQDGYGLCVTVMNINYYQRPPKTEQFIPTKISGNAWKLGV